MRTYTTLLTFSVAMLFVSQVLASPALEVSISYHVPLSFVRRS